jgi:hypothetical protein
MPAVLLLFGFVITELSVMEQRYQACEAENLVTVSEQHLLGGRPQQHRPDESQHDRPL